MRALLLSVIAFPLAAQSLAESFDAAYARFGDGHQTPARQRLAALASDLFLRMLPGSDERLSRLGSGLQVTLEAGRVDIAAEVADTVGDAAAADGQTVYWQQVAWARAGNLASFVAGMRRAREWHHDRQIAEVLALEEGRLLPLADRALRRGDTADGRAVFEALAALDPHRAYRYANLGLCLRNLGETEAAERAYDRAIELAPADAQIENDRGLLLRASGRRDAAMRAFRRSYDLDTAVAGGRAGDGPAITNLVHALAVRQPGAPAPAQDALPLGSAALGVRPEAVMLRRLVLDVALDRLGVVPERPGVVRERPGVVPERPGVVRERPGVGRSARDR